MKYIASWSGGKDSTASIILAHEHNEPLDLIMTKTRIHDWEERFYWEEQQMNFFNLIIDGDNNAD